MAVITGTSGADLLNGTAAADEISGLGGNDTLLGGNGNDSLTGGAGADSLVGGAGGDTLNGGGGNDTYVIDASDVLVDSGGIDTVRANFSCVLLAGFEKLVLLGSSAINGTGNTLANTITGNNAANSLNGGGGADTLNGGGGNDTLVGGAGADRLVGGSGNDTYVVDNALDVVVEGSGAGTDLVQSSVSIALLAANVENLALTGSANRNGTGNTFANVITGNTGNNVLSGGTGNDTLNGGTGNDTLDGGFGDDTLVYDAVDGRVQGGAGTDAVRIDGSGVTLDLTGIANTVHQDLEVIDLTGSGNNTLVLAGSDVSAFSFMTNTLRVTGNAGDAVATTDTGWLRIPDVIVGAHTYAQYTNGAATLQVDVDVNRSGINQVSAIALSSLNGANGFRLDGIDPGDQSGLSVATAGDVNGDGFDDLIIGAAFADPLGLYDTAGESYVVFGKASGFASSIDLATLNGANGFRLDGTVAFDFSGRSVAAAGDVNGDGFDDFIIGAYRARPGGDSYAGESYVVFGKASGFAPNINLASLNGTNGFRLDGIDPGDQSGLSVATAGDVNGDGFNDVIIGARYAGSYAGESYVVFGKASGFASSIDLATLNGANGFRLDGIDAGDFSGSSVAAAGDVNGDGFDDFIIGAPDGNSTAGEAYVVFGKASGFASGIDLGALDGADGFRLDGIDPDDSSGGSVAAAGDVNGDGFDDLIIGAANADPGGDSYAGESYVVFGKAGGFASSIDLATLNGASGFRLDGIDPDDRSGISVAAAGDVNGDGFDDIIIGARYGDSAAGEAYVVFGKASGFASRIDVGVLDGGNGFRLDGIDPNDASGVSVAAAGDVNGDGFDDLIIGAAGADPGGNSGAGESYLVFGRDFTGVVTHLGSSEADLMTGTAAAQTFVAAQGDDTIAGGGGADVFNAGGGNDLIQVSDMAFADIDGGSGGADTLAILGSGRTLSLAARPNNQITGIERINLAGSGDNTLRLAQRDLFDLSDTTNQLRVDGNAGDTVDLIGTWADGGVAGSFHTYTLGAATILIDNDIFVT